MKQLIEDYERRLKTAETMLERKNYGSITQAERIKTKASCYRTFIAELKQQLNLPNVVVPKGTLPKSYCPVCEQDPCERLGWSHPLEDDDN